VIGEMNTAIIGCGLIGQKRAGALAGSQLVACADLLPDRADMLAREFGNCRALSDWKSVLDRRDVDVVIVATTHEALAEITKAALSAGKHVLVEKPGARNAGELASVLEAAGRI
jgi:predicted dehydrogenase